MKYSLRSLFVVVTLICVALGILGGRIGYLRQQALSHEQEAEKIAAKMESQAGLPKGLAMDWFSGLAADVKQEALAKPSFTFILGSGDSRTVDSTELGAFWKHKDLAEAYRRTCFRPWVVVDESLPTFQAPAPDPPKS